MILGRRYLRVALVVYRNIGIVGDDAFGVIWRHGSCWSSISPNLAVVPKDDGQLRPVLTAALLHRVLKGVVAIDSPVGRPGSSDAPPSPQGVA